MLVSLTLVTWLFTIVSYVVAAPLFVREPLLATTGHRASPAAGPPDFSQFARYNVLWGRDANVASNSVVPGRIWHAIGSLGAGAPTLTPAMEQGWGSSNPWWRRYERRIDSHGTLGAGAPGWQSFLRNFWRRTRN